MLVMTKEEGDMECFRMSGGGWCTVLIQIGLNYPINFIVVVLKLVF